MHETDTILVAEDDEDEAILLRLAMERCHIDNPIRVLGSGQDVLNYINGEGDFSDRTRFPSPFLLLLDLGMPGIDGFEVLKQLRRQPQFKNLLIVVLTSSRAFSDIQRAYDLGANSFLPKPSDFPQLVEMVRSMVEYWSSQNRWHKRGETKDESGRIKVEEPLHAT